MGNRVGTLHFIRFPTSEMEQFLQLAKSKGFATLSSTFCATGGGAYKFEGDFLRVRDKLRCTFKELKTEQTLVYTLIFFVIGC